MISLKSAIDDFTQAISINPQFADAYINRGYAYADKDNYDSAINDFTQAIKINPSDELTYVHRGSVYLLKKDYEGAIDDINKALEINPDKSFLWYVKAIVLLENANYQDVAQEAVLAFEKSIELDESHVDSYINLAKLYLGLDDLKNARTTIEKSHNKIKDNSTISSIHGIVKLQEQKYYEAMQLFENAMQLDLGEIEHILWKAYAYYLHTDKSFELGSKEYNHNIISILRSLEKSRILFKDKAEEEITNPWLNRDKSISTEPINKLKSDILYFKGFCYYKQENYFKAIDKFKESDCCANKDDNKASDAIYNIWKNNIRPSIWQWWGNDPLKKWPKRIISFLLLDYDKYGTFTSVYTFYHE